MRVTNWGMFLLGIYLIIVGVSSFGLLNFRLSGIAQLAPLLALVAGVLILMDNWRR